MYGRNNRYIDVKSDVNRLVIHWLLTSLANQLKISSTLLQRNIVIEDW